MKINSDSIGNLFVTLFMCFIGLLFMITMAYKIYDYLRFQRQSIKAEGIITDSGCSSFFGCKPFIKYTDINHQVYEFRSKINFYFFAPPKEGAKLTVYYLKRNHRNAIISSTIYNIVQPLCYFSIGASIIIVLILRSIKQNLFLYNV